MDDQSTVQLALTFTLPTVLAQEAKAQGLLSPPILEELLRAELDRRRITQLFDAADRLAALPSAPLTEDELSTEIDAARAERHVARACGR